MKNGVKTTGYCIVEQTDPLAYKQKQLASWIYDVNGKEYKRKRTKSTPNKLQNYEYYTIYYKTDNKEEIFVDFTEFVLRGEYFNTKSVLVKNNIFNKDEVFFKYVVDSIEYERFQKVKFKKKDDSSVKYLVKYNVANPKIGYIYLDSIR